MESKNWRICRICLTELENLTNCTEITDIDNADNIQIITKITYCSQIELINPINNLPIRICQKCLNDLKLSYKFCMICQDSERKFQELEELNNNTKNCKKYKKTKQFIRKINRRNIDEENNIKIEIITPKEEPPSSSSTENNNENLVDYSSDLDFELHNDRLSLITRTNSIIGDDDDNDELKNTEFISISNNLNTTSQNLDFNNTITTTTSDPVRRRKYFKKPKVLEYRCEVCQEPFNTRSQMTLHMKTSHTQAYKCKDCNKAFDSNIARNKHERRAHMDPAIRPHKCDYCVRTFYRLDLLKKHKRVHTGEKPFVCEKCGTAFKQIHHLTNHSKSMTPCVLKMSIKI